MDVPSAASPPRAPDRRRRGPSEVVALLGDNGAGKSTLLKVMSGAHRPTAGTIKVHGREVEFHSPTDSTEAGIQMVYQDLALVEPQDIATNLTLGREILRKPPLGWLRFVDKKAQRKRSQGELDRLGVRTAAMTRPVEMLSGGQRQVVALARSATRVSGERNGVLLLEEPTAALGYEQTKQVEALIVRMVTAADLIGGQREDHRRLDRSVHEPTMDDTVFYDRSWDTAVERDVDVAIVRPAAPPVRRVEEIRPVEVRRGAGPARRRVRGQHVALPPVEGFDGPLGWLNGSAGWGDVTVSAPWDLYQAYGDASLLADMWGPMTAWVGFAAAAAADGRHPDRAAARPEPLPHERYLWDTGFHWGEWLEPGAVIDDFGAFARADKSEVATAYLYRSAATVARIASVLGLGEEQERRYQVIADGALDAWRREFVRADETLAVQTQASHVRALAFGLVSGEFREPVAKRLTELVGEAGGHLATGFLSTAYLLPVLADSGHLGTAYELLFQDTPPSWLAMIDWGRHHDVGGLGGRGRPRRPAHVAFDVTNLDAAYDRAVARGAESA